MMVTPGGELLFSDPPSGIDLTRGSTYPDLRRKLATRSGEVWFSGMNREGLRRYSAQILGCAAIDRARHHVRANPGVFDRTDEDLRRVVPIELIDMAVMSIIGGSCGAVCSASHNPPQCP